MSLLRGALLKLQILQLDAHSSPSSIPVLFVHLQAIKMLTLPLPRYWLSDAAVTHQRVWLGRHCSGFCRKCSSLCKRAAKFKNSSHYSRCLRSERTCRRTSVTAVARSRVFLKIELHNSVTLNFFYCKRPVRHYVEHTTVSKPTISVVLDAH